MSNVEDDATEQTPLRPVERSPSEGSSGRAPPPGSAQQQGAAASTPAGSSTPHDARPPLYPSGISPILSPGVAQHPIYYSASKGRERPTTQPLGATTAEGDGWPGKEAPEQAPAGPPMAMDSSPSAAAPVNEPASSISEAASCSVAVQTEECDGPRNFRVEKINTVEAAAPSNPLFALFLRFLSSMTEEERRTLEARVPRGTAQAAQFSQPLPLADYDPPLTIRYSIPTSTYPDPPERFPVSCDPLDDLPCDFSYYSPKTCCSRHSKPYSYTPLRMSDPFFIDYAHREWL